MCWRRSAAWAWFRCVLLVDVSRFPLSRAIDLCRAFATLQVKATDAHRFAGEFVEEFKANLCAIAVSPDGEFLVVADTNFKIVQVRRASDRSLVRSIGQGVLKNPNRVAISPDGSTVFVSDWALQAVLQYRMDGTLVRRIGSKGQAAGQFVFPRGLVVSKAGELFVADCENHRVQVFRVSDGACLRQIGGAQGSGNVNMPLDVALSPDETELLVVDLDNHRIQVFRARDGQYLRGWGSEGSADGEFDSPQALVVSGSGEVMVADSENYRVCVFSLDGTFRRSIGSRGSGPGQFNRPFRLAYSEHSRHVLVLNIGDSRVQVLR